MKKVIIDSGGGLLDVFGAGVLDFCLDNDLQFDYCLGVSAGSANLSSFVAKQRGRNYRFYSVYSARKEYMSLYNLQKYGSFVNLDYAYGQLSNEGGEDPLDYQAFISNPSEYIAVSTDAYTGKSVYFDKSQMQKNAYFPIMTSSSVPGMNKPYPFAGGLYYDGLISDLIPLEKAIELGGEKIVIILSQREEDGLFDSDLKLCKKITQKYPECASALLNRRERITKVLEKAKDLQEKLKVLILSPNSSYGVSTFTRSEEGIKKLYDSGYSEANKIIEFLNK